MSEMKQFRACTSATWDNWDDGPELIWTLIQTKYDRSTLIRCVCKIAEHTLEIYEKENPGDNRPRKAIEAARIVAEDNTPKNRDAADSAAYAAEAAAYAARATADAAADAAYDAAEAAAYAAADAERAWQADCVRRHFPVSPFLMEVSN